ncbi:DUF167 domain-containing protein [Enhygromyxa salina]|uniref:UPF0235 protein ENSA7_33070 n=1 Tax=Enhygromyxa salina TaxID=215803 RepID=A0A2S9YPF6_9BACT|nr:DUF167 domain-containing protein [Enhygromyxa salina]PRQ06973.1 hypothetical protein ENSA7_33070 [Enhygromyxa salina]
MLRVRPDGAIEIDVHAVPKSSRDAVGKPHGGRLKLHVKAAPVDGRANAAIIKLIGKTLGVPRDQIELVHGQAGKRKTVRISPHAGLTSLADVLTKLGLEDQVQGQAHCHGDGVPAPGSSAQVGLLLLLALVGVGGCESPRELPITVMLPADVSDYDRADNASVVMRPSGDVFSFDVDGLDFTLELEGPPSTEAQQLELYLADGEELLAWGATAPFASAAPDVGLALFLGRPGLLSSWPEQLDAPDPLILGARAIGRGMLLVQADGDTFLLNHYTLLLESGSRLPDTAGFSTDPNNLGSGLGSGLFSAANGTVVRLGWDQPDPIAWRYDPGADTWTELDLASPGAGVEVGGRAGAAVLTDPDDTRVYLLGGGGSTDGVAIDLIADAQGVLAAAPVADFALDGPRDGATALWIPTQDDPTADVLLVGGDADAPLAVLSSVGAGVGPSMAWRGLGCAIQTPTPTQAGVAVVCVGGSIDAVPTADALTIDVIPGASAQVDVHESFLPVALPDPLMFSDASALYTQGEGRWFRIARDGLTVTEPNSSPARASGGHLVSLENGVTFVVGGVNPEGAALDRWQVFTPAL